MDNSFQTVIRTLLARIRAIQDRYGAPGATAATPGDTPDSHSLYRVAPTGWGVAELPGPVSGSTLRESARRMEDVARRLDGELARRTPGKDLRRAPRRSVRRRLPALQSSALPEPRGLLSCTLLKPEQH